MPNTSFNEQRQIGAYKEAITAELTPVIQVKFPYALAASSVTTSVTGSGTATVENSMAKLSTTTATSSTSELITDNIIVYQAGQGATAKFTAIFTKPKQGSEQIIGIGDTADGYYIGYTGTQFSALRIQNGLKFWKALPLIGNGTDTFLGQLNLTRGNVFQIQYQWLGFGQIIYSVFDPSTQSYTPMHIEKYPNRFTKPSTFNPSFPMRMFVENTANSTAINLWSASLAAFIEGKATNLVNFFAGNVTKTIAVATELPLITIRVKSTFHGKPTRSLVFPGIVTAAVDGTKPVTFRLYKNAILGGTPVWTDIDTDKSTVEIDTSATSATGVTADMIFKVDKEDSFIFDIEKRIKLTVGDTYTLVAESVLSSEVESALSWRELI